MLFLPTDFQRFGKVELRLTPDQMVDFQRVLNEGPPPDLRAYWERILREKQGALTFLDLSYYAIADHIRGTGELTGISPQES